MSLSRKYQRPISAILATLMMFFTLQGSVNAGIVTTTDIVDTKHTEQERNRILPS